ncbi:hypothetical protein M0R45_037442 [Rubus argutus]|uniref:DUF4283 domain-containing protein n=1 Tax=Rubus argutus TaxID=59490 RepID=A0AAW1W2E8_RUBAR
MGSHDHLAALLEDTLNIHDVHQPTIFMGAMIADVLPNIGGVKGSLHTAWKDFGSFQISHLRRNLFCIKMNQEGAKRLLQGGPWHVEKHHFNVVPWPPNCTINDVPYYMVSYWVQISGLTLEKMNDSNARLIGSAIGEVIQLEDIQPVDAFLRGYLRIRINFDSRRPFPAGFWLPISNNKTSRVEYSYEGLGTFCWRCAMLGHNMDNCHSRNIISPADSVWFGPWMSCKTPRSPPTFADKQARVHRRKPSVQRVNGEEGHSPYRTSNNATRHYRRAQVNNFNPNIPYASASIEVQHSPPSPTNGGASFVVTDTIEKSVGGVFSPNAFPSPNWYKLAVTTATTHVQWTKKNYKPMPQAHSEILSGIHTLVKNGKSPQHHSTLQPTTSFNTFSSPPILPASFNKHSQESIPPPPKFKRFQPKAVPPGKPQSLLILDIKNKKAPKITQLNQSPPPETSLSYQRNFKRLASEVDLDCDVTNYKSRVVIDDTFDSVGLNLKRIPCGVARGRDPCPRHRRSRSVGNQGSVRHTRKAGRVSNSVHLSGSFPCGIPKASPLGPDALILSSSKTVLVETTSDVFSESHDDIHILEGQSQLQGSGGWPTATRSQ